MGSMKTWPSRTTGGRRMAAVVLGLSLAYAAPASAQTVLVKMATLVPDGSSWHLILKETADKWRTLSNGTVTVRLYAGGVAGDDPDVVRKMRLGTLNAGVLTSVGVAEIDKSVYALGVPMMYDSYDELYYVLEKMRPRLESGLEAKGFVVLNWADGGWVHFFTQKPVAVPDDLKAQKLFSWAGDATSVDLWKSAGFNPIPLPSTEIATALQTGLVNALGCPAAIGGHRAVLQQREEHDRPALAASPGRHRDQQDGLGQGAGGHEAGPPAGRARSGHAAPGRGPQDGRA